MTCQRFAPALRGSGSRAYRTGDASRFAHDGEVEYRGRLDLQVKVRGFRIELGEIEAALTAFAPVSEAVVLAREDVRGDKSLVAYVVPRGGRAPSAREMETFLSTRLPEYMVPARYVLLKTFPLTTSGKVDRRSLPAPDAQSGLDEGYAPPTTQAEEILAEIWSDVLGVDGVGVHDDYYALGGNSIRTAQIQRRAEARGLLISIRDFYRARTIAAFAKLAHERTGGQSVAPLPNVSVGDETRARLECDDAYPATSMQEVMLDAYAGDAARIGVFHFQQSRDLEADDEIDVGAIREAIATTVERHPTFRLTFVRSPAGTLQVVRRRPALDYRLVDLRGSEAEEQARPIDEAAAVDRATAFAPTDPTAALIRATVFQLARGRVTLLMSMHHAIIDGWSNQQLLRELRQAYFALRAGQKATASARPNTQKDVAALERELRGSAEAAAFWRAQASSAPHALPRRSFDADALFERRLALGEELYRALAAHARTRKVSPRAVLLAALTSTEAPGIEAAGAVGVVLNGRSSRMVDADTAIGLFWNVLPLALDSGPWNERVVAAQTLLERAEPYALYPSSELGPGAVLHRVFNFVQFDSPAGASGALRLLGGRTRDLYHYPLTLSVLFRPWANNADLLATCNPAYFDERELEPFLSRYRSALARALAT